jgi:group II intron reverse transcriptase/maturase
VDTIQILKIQKELAQRTIAEPQSRHKRLYRFICDEGWLRAGLEAVLTNRGSNTPGLDGVTRGHIDKKQNGREILVRQLQEELLTKEYHPAPVERIYIPKPNGKTRPLGIAIIRDRVVQATIKMVLEPVYESVFYPFSWGFRPLRSTHHALSAIRRGPSHPKNGYKWIIEGDITSCFDEICHRLLRRFLKKRIQDQQLLDLITRLLRCGIWEDGRVTYPQTGTPQGSVLSPLLANVFLHEFDEWYFQSYRVRPEWSHFSTSWAAKVRRKEIGGSLIYHRYADDWVALWNGSRARAEEIKDEIKIFLADELKLRLSEEKTLITHIDDGFDFLGYRMTGNKRWSDGQWCLFTKVPPKAIKRFRENVKQITRKTFTDEVAALTALSGLIRGWGNYYAYAAESRLMHSLEAYVYKEVWKYFRRKNVKLGAKAVYRKYILPRPLRQTGYLSVGVVVDEQVTYIPRLSGIPRKPLKLPVPAHPYLSNERNNVLPQPGTTDEWWWNQHVWIGQEGPRQGQKRLAVAVLARDKICQMCGLNPATEVHHQPPWKDVRYHDPNQAMGVCTACHKTTLLNVVKLDGELR